MARLLLPSVKDLGEFEVARVLPHAEQRMVGPYVFFDHMGPANFAAGQGVNVRPHPHIGLATLTYLLEGKILHRDSLGSHQEIVPGDVNWMVAGRGITHSERETLEHHAQPHCLDGIQCWVALPQKHAEIEPSFTHVARERLPHWIFEGVTARLVIGEAYGMSSPIKTFSPMFLLDVIAHQGSTVERPNPGHECLVYVVSGTVETQGDKGSSSLKQGDMAILDPEEALKCDAYTRLIFLGGEPWETKPHLFWNFVAFDKERIEQAKDDWRNGRFAPVAGDDQEFIPLP